MSGRIGKFRLGVAAVFLVLSAGVASVHAEELKTADQIFNALIPKEEVTTRSLSGGDRPAAKTISADDRRFLNSLRTKQTRSLSVGERERVANIAKEKPAIDLTINFDFNSAVIGARTLPAVTELGKALSRPQAKDRVFLLAGHTDAKGGDIYNQLLSERRADAIKRYLMEKFGISAENLVTVGYGKTQLKNAANPFADENRRVQVVNMESSREARN